MKNSRERYIKYTVSIGWFW